MNDIWVRIIREIIFIVGSIIFLYSLWLLWGKRSFEKANKDK